MLVVAIARYLDGLDVVTFDETGGAGDCFIATMPSTPDEAVMVMPTGGVAQPTLHPEDDATIQFLVRGPRHDPRPGYVRARAIYAALVGLGSTVLDPAGPDEVHVISISPLQSDAVGLGQDDNQRHEWSLNFLTRVHAPTVHRPAVTIP